MSRPIEGESELNGRMKRSTVRLSRRGFLTATGVAVAVAGAGAGLVPLTAGAREAGIGRKATVATSFAVPAEDIRHTRTWMAWPDRASIWGADLKGVQRDIARIARTIARYEEVVLCANPGSASQARALCGDSVTVVTDIPVDDCWMRDTGPVFRLDDAGRLDAVGLNFNGWGGKQVHARDSLVAGRIAAYAGVPFSRCEIVGEGGAIEQDGQGTLMATRSSLVNGNRNPGRSEREIEDALLRAYGATELVWFDGVRGQDITDDHVDATSRFVGSRGAVVQVPFPADADAFASDARKQSAILSQTIATSGDPLQVTHLAGPDYDSIRVADPNFLASYANFYVCNDAVISGQFGDVEADAAAKAVLAGLFPGRTIEQLNIDHLGTGGGGIHCVTQQQPTA